MQEQTQSEETKQSSDPDFDMTQMLELSSKKFKITVINMISALMEKSRQQEIIDG